MNESMQAALQTIIGGSPVAAAEAVRTLRAIQAGSPIVQTRYNRTAELALGDPDASFTADERRLLAASVALPDEGTDRSVTLHVRLTADEDARLRDDAASAGRTVSDYVRGRLFDGV